MVDCAGVRVAPADHGGVWDVSDHGHGGRRLPRCRRLLDEALARLWAWEDAQRPADKELLDTRPTAATGALRKSGAGLMIRQVADALGGVMVPM